MAEKLYPCDPSKNKECNKRGCYQNGGPCRSTTHAEYCDAGDLISKQALLYALDGIELIEGGDVDSNELESLIKRLPTIEAEPTFEQIEEYCRKRCLVVVDVALFNEMKSRWSAEPRKHGHWIWRGGNLYECSECGAIVVAQDYIPIGLHYFCRGCGADMRGSKDE